MGRETMGPPEEDLGIKIETDRIPGKEIPELDKGTDSLGKEIPGLDTRTGTNGEYRESEPYKFKPNLESAVHKKYILAGFRFRGNSHQGSDLRVWREGAERKGLEMEEGPAFDQHGKEIDDMVSVWTKERGGKRATE